MRPYKQTDTETLKRMIAATQKALRHSEALNLTIEEQGELNRMLNLLLDELSER